MLDFQPNWGLKVEEEHTGVYDRDKWGDWREEVNEVLRWRKADCRWAFYATSSQSACDVNELDPQRDHLVAVKEAFKSGGWDETIWDDTKRRDFYNDTENLFVLSQKENGSKGDKDPDGWLPDRNKCDYVEKWIDIKRKWGLSADPAELAAIREVLVRECDQTSPAVITAMGGGATTSVKTSPASSTTTSTAAPTTTAPATTTSTTAAAAVAGSTGPDVWNRFQRLFCSKWLEQPGWTEERLLQMVADANNAGFQWGKRAGSTDQNQTL